MKLIAEDLAAFTFVPGILIIGKEESGYRAWIDLGFGSAQRAFKGDAWKMLASPESPYAAAVCLRPVRASMYNKVHRGS
jgi:hypothetical protein